MSRIIITISALALLVTTLAGRDALAQDKTDDLVPDEIKAKKVEKLGFVPKLTLGVGLAFAHSSSVVGTQDGQTWNISGAVDAAFDYYAPTWNLRNSIAIRHTQSKTPQLDQFVKTADSFVLESIFQYKISAVPWLGPFVQAKLDTALLPGEDVQPGEVEYAITRQDGTEEKVKGDSLDLTGAFAPLQLKQAAGLFAKPVNSEPALLEFRLGVGAREVFVRDGLALADKDDTADLIEVTQLQDYQQVGGEFFAGISGTITFEKLGKERPLTYGLGIELLVPFFSSVEDERDALDLMNVLIEAKLGVKLFSWMSLDYSLRAVRLPLIVDEFQIQNSLLLNFSYSIL